MYKRQEWKRTYLGVVDAEGGLYLNGSDLAKIGYLYPVSYTHLDVYKRQGKVHGILQAHSEINHVDNHLEHRGDDDGSAGSAEHQERLVIFQDDGGSHGRKRALAGRDGISLALHESEHVGCAGLGGEVVHFVVQQKSGAGQSDAAAVSAIQGVGDGNCVALVVHDAVVRGVGALSLIHI